MPTTDTSVSSLIINKLTKQQYNQIQNPSETELYVIPDEIDITPTNNSDNTVTSGGVYTALQSKVSKTELSAQGYITSIPSEYITQAELSANAYLTEHQSLAAYPTKTELSAQAYLKAVPDEYVTQAELSANGYLTTHQDLTTYAKKSDAIGSLSLLLDSSDYKITLSGTKVDGTAFTVDNVIDLPLESVVVSGYYDSTNKKVALTLENGNVIDFSVADLVNGLQSEITSSNKLSADLVQDGSTNKVVTATEKADWNSRVTKAELSAQAYLKAVPTEYVTQAELSANAYLTEHQSLAAYPTKAELSAQAYLQSETDPVFVASAAHEITSNDISKWNSGVTKAELSAQAYLKTIPAEYVTQAELSANAYLTEHQSLAAYPTKADLSAQAYLKSETDPVFVASVAHGITSQNITDWNAKVSKAELSAQSYLKSETDPVFVASAAHGITSQNITDWNAKVSKAELSAQAYLKSETDPVFTASAAHGITSNDITKWNSGVTKAELSAQAYLQTESDGQFCLSDAAGTTFTTKFTAGTNDNIEAIRFVGGSNTSISMMSANKQNPARVTISAYNCLPTVSSTDNGKVLQVVNGAWALVTPVSVYTGSGTPSNSIGNNGDLYMQTI